MKQRLPGCLILAVLSLLLASPSGALAGFLSLDEIRAILVMNPPTTGDPALRDNALLSLDEHLLMPDAGLDPNVHQFGLQMLSGVPAQLAYSVSSGARIWQMYNHGFIVKTPTSTFAFDLVDAGPYIVPDEVLQQIDVAFISHDHGDHWGRPSQRIVELGGALITPLDLAPGAQTSIRGLDVSNYYGEHGGMDNRIYHITTPDGLTVMHTGDTQHSSYLPTGLSTDILLINAWLNTTGVRDAMDRILPELTIPGHIHELGHQPAARATYASALAVDDVPIPGELTVMAWGEHYDYNVVPEPSSLTLWCGAAAMALVAGIWRNRRRSQTTSPAAPPVAE